MGELLVGRYELREPLSQGGFGQTYLALDHHLPGLPPCVVKQLHPELHDGSRPSNALRLFEQEAQILYQLGDHPQIPRLLAHFEAAGRFYLVQDYIEGNTLERELGQPWPASAVETMVREVLTVLAFVHDQGVIHRDLKPSNLMRRRQDGRLMLIDFGAVKAFTPQRNITIGIGTPGYMPAEQQAGQPQYSSDLFALGMIALEALTGTRPDRLSPAQRLPLLESLPLGEPLATVLKRCIQIQGGDRYPNAATALASLTGTTPPPHRDTPTIPMSALAVTTQSPPRPPVSQDRNREILLNKVRNFWVKGVLERSLHGRVLLELGLREESKALARPWGVVWQGAEREERLITGESVADRFAQLGTGRTLLILGEPGAGKTTTLLELARDLLDQAATHPQALIPVVLNLSSWRGKQTLGAWVIQELQRQYQVAPSIGRDWVKNQALLLLLDGLDEVRAEVRSPCVAAINQFITDYGQTELVVCCRVTDYFNLGERLRLQAAVSLQPLTLPQIRQYLQGYGAGLTVVSDWLETDPALQALAQSPLMLSIITLAYRDLPAEHFQQRGLDATTLRTDLFNTYIERMLNRHSGRLPYSPQRLRYSLARLARQMQRDSQTVFFIEQMQPTWCDPRQRTHRPWKRWAYTLGVGLLGTAIAGLGAGVNLGLLISPAAGVNAAIILGIGGGFTLAFTFGLREHPIEPVDLIRWSSRKAKANLKLGLQIGLLVMILSMFAYVIFGFTLGWTRTVWETFLYGLCGLGTGIIYILLQGLSGGSIPTSTIPNQGIFQSLRYTAFFALIGVVTLTIVAGFLGLPLLVGVTVGLIFGWASPAGIACLQHFMLRLLLYLDGSLPWNLAQFLDTATRLILLQKVGGGYIFIHRLLLEHFATIISNNRT
ncbi:protein kinase [Spirulina sp. CCNP1310]|uniref:protein kinase domain-containing protein n=1 Tax=Spirulina sp. CCNP1310 TaxID=3110249 RepID=UPI002B1FA056|nr:protein kinase [Spirulina sp. CCNP1310]MEA5420670.1 protein kinase [Spirulina sp. CCNP1310]